MTGAQKSKLRGIGQRLDPQLNIGHEGINANVLVEFNRVLDKHELIKVRYFCADRDERALLTEKLAAVEGVIHAGSVGATALFYRQQKDPAKREIDI